MHERGREAMRLRLTTEVTRRFGPDRAATLGRDIDALLRFGRFAGAELPAETEPAFYLLEGDS
jgi:hypothetical protein